jgi:hypothetical protein
MEFEHILQPLLNAGMIKKTGRSTNIIDAYDYTPKALDLIGIDDDWHFGNVSKNESPMRLIVWLPHKRQTNNYGDTFGGFNDSGSYRYITVNDNPEELYGTEFEERVKVLFDGLGITYQEFNDDYVELDDICL